ncbi:RHS repeat-associated core domain-containing protein [Thermoactinomyces sp. DSM 45891]|uniref:DNRLRE domain-containing protein n=1 Tax=Thermoactinomyces sp. DSM 45891 TaxID=1761907 RepID=UPI0009172CA9|nr:DNRLRE domain-containing protein [Thermoactinomyces sp. DSM 45891]SFX68203.1 RHS repeat-associated core domain-containing protein [Thermoactinomyces sp. DSM 45891]
MNKKIRIWVSVIVTIFLWTTMQPLPAYAVDFINNEYYQWQIKQPYAMDKDSNALLSFYKETAAEKKAASKTPAAPAKASIVKDQIIDWGEPVITLNEPTKLHGDGAELSWSKYTGSGFIEYQIHRSTQPNFTPSESTLIAPIDGVSQTQYRDTTAPPFPAHGPGEMGQIFYYMVTVKTTDSKIFPSKEKQVQLPKAGLTLQVIRQAEDTTLSSAKPTTNLDKIDGKSFLSVGNMGPYGTTRSVIKFDLSSLPTGVKVSSSYLALMNSEFEESDDKTPTKYDVYSLAKGFTEEATWNTPWSQPGGDIEIGSLNAISTSYTAEWHLWKTTPAVQAWLNGTKTNNGFLLKFQGEGGSVKERTAFHSSESPDTSVRPKLMVIYSTKSAANNYHAPSTPSYMTSGAEYVVDVTLTNTTEEKWSGSTDKLSYHWIGPDGKEITNARLDSPLRPVDEKGIEAPTPIDVNPGQTIKVRAKVKAPELTGSQSRESYSLRWDLSKNGKWLSQDANPVAVLEQKVAVEKKGEEKGFGHNAAHISAFASADSKVGINVYQGNVTFFYKPYSNPSRGFETYAQLNYNSLSTTDSGLGKGWSLGTGSVVSIGAPATNGAMVNSKDEIISGSVVVVDEEGESHEFTWNKSKNKFDPPPGLNLSVEYISGKDKRKKWVFTEQDRVQYFLDDRGYTSEIVDKNGNKLIYEYEERKIDNKPKQLLRRIKDSMNRETLKISYNDRNKVDYIDDIAGRRMQFVYDDQDRLVKLMDGIDVGKVVNVTDLKTYRFEYHPTLKSHITKVTDSRGNPTTFEYHTSGDLANKVTKMTNRAKENLFIDYNANQRIVTDANKDRHTEYSFDGKGRQTQVSVITKSKTRTTKYEYDDDDNMIRLEEPNGAVTTWKYNEHGQPLMKTDQENNALSDASARKSTLYEYQTGMDGRVSELVKETSPEGREVRYTYDANGNMLTKQNSMSLGTTYTYWPGGLLKSASDVNGHATISDEYDANGLAQKTTDAKGNVTWSTYGPRGETLTTTNPKGKRITMTYDIYKRLEKTEIPKDLKKNEYITQLAPIYDQNGNVIQETSATGAETFYEYDAMDRVIETKLPSDTDTKVPRVKKSEYNNVGKLIKETEPNGSLTKNDDQDYITTYEYDDFDQLIATTNSLGHKITYEYDDVGNQIKTTMPEGIASTADDKDHTIRKEYDKNHRVVREIDAKDQYTHTTYDADGLVTRIKDKDGNNLYKYYDRRGLLKEERVPHNGKELITKYDYDGAGNLLKVETPRGVATPTKGDFVQEKVYDELNRVTEIIYPHDGKQLERPKMTYQYDELGNVTEVTTPGSYGQVDRIKTKMTYYDTGWLRSIEDPFGVKTEYQYDDLGKQTERDITSADGKLKREMGWAYQPDGKVKQLYDSGLKLSNLPAPFYKKMLQYTYDANGNLVETRDLSTNANVDKYKMKYNHVNQVISIEEWKKEKVTKKFDYTYDRNGNLFNLVYPGQTSYYYYDAVNQVSSMMSQTGENEAQWTEYQRTPSGKLKQVTLPNGNQTTYSYYEDQKTKEMQTKKQDGTLLQRHFLEYNENGHRTKDITTLRGADNQQMDTTYRYEYDVRDRLIKAEKEGKQKSFEKYILDANSNIVEKNKDNQFTRFYYDRNRLTSETKDGVTSDYQYDSMGRVESIKEGEQVREQYGYDPFDNVREHIKTNKETKDPIKTQFAYDSLDRTIAKVEQAGTDQSKKTNFDYLGTTEQVISEEVADQITRSYVYSAWGERMAMTKAGEKPETSYYGTNTDVDVELLTDEKGNVRATYGYSPYGENDESLFTGVDKPDPNNPTKEMYNSFRYSGKRWDPNTKSYDLGFRNYSPEQGRFLTQDSYTDAGKFKELVMDPRNANQYGFAAGNPVSSTDLDGHIEIMIENDDFPLETYIAATGSHYCPLKYCSDGKFKKATPDRIKKAKAHVNALVKRNKAADKAAAERKRKKSHPTPSKPKSQAPPKPKPPSAWKAIAHNILDVAGTFDPTGAIDAAHAGWYLFEGDYENAFYTGMGVFPGGDAFKIAKNTKNVSSTTKRAIEASCKCFVAGTRIETEDGGKPIEEIDIGDKVLAKNEETGEIAYKEVEWLFQREIDEIYEVHIGGEVIQTTDEHPFWVVGEGWVRAKDLRKGDLFETDKGKKLAVDKIVKKKQKATVYNFKVKDFHTYYVSNLKVLTHNKCYRDTFFEAYPELKGKVVVHHAVEQQAMRRYPGKYTNDEMHSLDNLRGIPKEINSSLHLSTIRKEWNQFYKANPNATKGQLSDKARDVDDKYGHLFNPPIR